MDQSLEKWRPVVGYEGLYEVSNLGRVRSLTRVVLRSNGASQTVRGRVRKLVTDNHGYVGLVLRKPKDHATRKVHQLVLEAFIGPAKGLHCRHLDGNKTNNRLSNLAYGSRRDNEADKLAHGTRARGETNGHAKLTEDAVRHIRTNPECSNKVLADRFNVHPSAIGHVRRGATWRHVDA